MIDEMFHVTYHVPMDADRILTIRKATGMNRSQFARTLGVEYGTVRRWEMGTFKPLPVFVRMLEKIESHTPNPSPGSNGKD